MVGDLCLKVVLTRTTRIGAVSIILVASPWGSIWTFFLFIFLLAIAETNGTINLATLGDYFGRKAYGRLRGIWLFVSTPGVLVAPVFTGWWYDMTESYALPLWVFAILNGLTALTFALMRKPEKVQSPNSQRPQGSIF